jgi:hypothetical protein
VSDGTAPRKLPELFGSKDILNQTHPSMDEELLAVARNDACGFLPSVLERVQAEVCEIRGFTGPVHAKHATLIVKVIVVHRPHRLS